MELDGSNGPFGQSKSPKVEVTAQSSLFLISYTDVPSLSSKWQISVFIDIPTIDFYKDELANSKLSRFNKQFKLQNLKENIFKSFTGGNEEFWNQWVAQCDQGDHKFVMRVSSSGSLRYVETIRFLVESVYQKLQMHQERLRVEFWLDASPTSHKWFTTFLNPRLLQSGIVRFNHVSTQANTMPSSPFKEYYSLLSKKFEDSQSSDEESQPIDSIVIVTNSTGVRALLTILSDRPLTNFISRESIEMLHDSALKKARGPSDEEDTPLKRESSSLLSFQNQLITSNKDKSVRVRSLSLNRRASVATPPSVKQQRMEHATPADQDEAAYENQLDISDEEDDDDDENESNSDKIDDDDDDGISFNVPSKLSHTRSSDFIAGGWNAGMNGRVRSLSLMDPPLRKPFSTTQGGGLPLSMTNTGDETSSGDNMRITNIYVHDGDFQDSTDPSSTAVKKPRKKPNRLPSRQSSANGLIPPEFYSRISSPSTSASSSNTSLQNFSIAPGTFSKMAPTGVTNQGSGNTDSLFEKNLINKSFEETRKSNLLDSIIEKLRNQDQHPDKNGLALNFVSNKTIPSQILDEEDLLMSGAGGVNINRNFSVEQISNEDDHSNSTVVPSQSKGTVDKEEESANTIAPPKVALDLSKIKLYDDDPAPPSTPSQPQETPAASSSSNDRARPKYKKAVTLDLYGDDDLENSGGWVLGGNSR
ncbi:hypothetical protein ZYGM_001002 [Zygosaccharomyces mellis]|uniref:Uncharacterized protein n=1 Tax=Zygosaccharomyces mellis TaxID=42258 RepID=A0A4C2EBC1_9SACH|nr:hypothetical protein ZYGM_001002 [Zygosaccharomyces mellis]